MAIHPFLYFWSQHIFLSRFARDLLGQLVKHILHLNGAECDRDGWCTKRRELKYFNVQHLSGSEVSRWIFFVVTRALLFLEIFRRSTVGWDSSHKSAHQTLQKAVFDGVTLLLHVLVHKSENLFSFFQLLFALLQVECDVNFSFRMFRVTIEIVFQVQLICGHENARDSIARTQECRYFETPKFHMESKHQTESERRCVGVWDTNLVNSRLDYVFVVVQFKINNNVCLRTALLLCKSQIPSRHCKICFRCILPVIVLSKIAQFSRFSSLQQIYWWKMREKIFHPSPDFALFTPLF